jgi:hypothetical protein
MSTPVESSPLRACDDAINHYRNAISHALDDKELHERKLKAADYQIKLLQDALDQWLSAKEILEGLRDAG